MEIKILHVEDNPDDVMLVGLAFRKAGVEVKVEVASDGEKAIKMLENMAPVGTPVCILLDVKLPSISGHEVLAWIRRQPRVRSVPVVMLTSSQIPNDINKAYELGANSYLV